MTSQGAKRYICNPSEISIIFKRRRKPSSKKTSEVHKQRKIVRYLTSFGSFLKISKFPMCNFINKNSTL